jgi:hypothetical protein
MNPELLRNLWLEASPRRLAIMFGVIAFLLAAVWVSGESERLKAVSVTAEFLFYALVVVWGTRNAAGAVVDEIRDRTWDLQRLSAISPWEMVWGKLLGAASYAWAGGLMCLVPITVFALQERGLEAALLQLAYFISIGLIAHSAALLTSMVAVRRRMGQSRLNTFGFLIVGLVAASYTWSIWSAATPSALGVTPWGGEPVASIQWYGRDWSAPIFLLTSLGLGFFWLLVGCHQFMRHELAVRMSPWAWIGFLTFIAGYFAGFAWPGVPFAEDIRDMTAGQAAGGWAVATGVLLSATYVSLLVMPKERVQMRWVLAQLGQGRVFSFFEGLPGWAFGFVFTAVAAAMAIAEAATSAISAADVDLFRMFVVAVMGELARNIGVFMFFNMLPGQRRGDFAALLTLFLVYTVLPLFLGGLGTTAVAGFISPWAEATQHGVAGTKPEFLVSTMAMWVQAAIIWPLAMLRLSRQQA